MSPSATPATQSGAAPRACHACNAKRRWICNEVPCLPRTTTVDVTKRHACHAKRRWMSPSATPATPATQSGAAPPATQHAQARHQSQPIAPSGAPGTRNEGGCHQVPCLPRTTKVDVTKWHACHAKRRWMSPSTTPATQSGAAFRATQRAQGRSKCYVKVDVTKFHACHAKRRWMSPSVTPATRNEGGCHQVSRLPRETKVDVTKCHACHAKLVCDKLGV